MSIFGQDTVFGRLMGAPTGHAGVEQTPRLNRREAERLLTAELVDELRHFMQTMTEGAARLAGRIVNDVLQCELVVFDAAATPVFRTFHVAIGAVEVRNLSAANTITVTSQGPAGAAPTSGVGIWKVPPSTKETINLASRQVTIYGAAGDQVEFQAFTKAASPVAV
jgi:hypothetical protein